MPNIGLITTLRPRSVTTRLGRHSPCPV